MTQREERRFSIPDLRSYLTIHGMRASVASCLLSHTVIVELRVSNQLPAACTT